MIRMIAVFAGFLSIAWCENSVSRQERKEGFESFFDGETLEPVATVKRGSHLALAVFVGKTRLIDNGRL